MKLATDDLVLRLRMGGAILLIPLYAFMTWTGEILPFFMNVYIWTQRYAVPILHQTDGQPKTMNVSFQISKMMELYKNVNLL
jgi:hypothetical protein